ncbi:HK97 gp10 family phage protein [Clostridium botulinum]|uniref:HK97 gp10 family phage protein n=1 Tax=Clostridium botulinum TaxID=1491 RepID=UPI0013F0F186|nr:HK97 gp10 family phage protein [Clostridium botulinum]MBY6898006.1 HK97 gp10 family phage protein [Clostridium botulinum]MBY6912319.1 HK97 gp10 family phage protein [Clostridium botulinum]MCR1176411.1 HK97 gp10 family phage protein [Clostridium botulinum]NEZ80626.1 HK97 gp10 family phage protein [Clostridium botulinum]NFA18152.1 HK97 gp10 family phage protein [Clostridium botulinum]
MANGFDTTQLDKFSKNLLNIAKNEYPKKTKTFLRKEARKLNKTNKQTFEAKGIGEYRGNLKKGFKAGKLYKYKGKELAIRAYNSSPHAHLLNDGWMHKAKNGNEKFIPGFHFIEDSAKAFNSEYYEDIDEFLDELFD